MRVKLAALLLLVLLTLCGCRFVAVETGSVRVEAPVATPQVTAAEGN